jgi:hypothetical protein
VTRANIARAAAAIAAVLVTTVALGCAGSADEQTASTGGGAGAGGAAFLSKANTACLQARAGATPAGAAQLSAPSAARLSSSRQGRRVRAHARRSLPLATRTLAVLRTLRPSGEGREALARLESEYQRLFMIYTEAAAPRRQPTKGLAAAVGTAEESVRAQARAARLPACSP